MDHRRHVHSGSRSPNRWLAAATTFVAATRASSSRLCRATPARWRRQPPTAEGAGPDRRTGCSWPIETECAPASRCGRPARSTVLQHRAADQCLRATHRLSPATSTSPPMASSEHPRGERRRAGRRRCNGASQPSAEAVGELLVHRSIRVAQSTHRGDWRGQRIGRGRPGRGTRHDRRWACHDRHAPHDQAPHDSRFAVRILRTERVGVGGPSIQSVHRDRSATARSASVRSIAICCAPLRGTMSFQRPAISGGALATRRASARDSRSPSLSMIQVARAHFAAAKARVDQRRASAGRASDRASQPAYPLGDWSIDQDHAVVRVRIGGFEQQRNVNDHQGFAARSAAASRSARRRSTAGCTMASRRLRASGSASIRPSAGPGRAAGAATSCGPKAAMIASKTGSPGC